MVVFFYATIIKVEKKKEKLEKKKASQYLQM